MVPRAKAMVYYVRPDGEVVADGLSFNVEGIFENQVKHILLLCVCARARFLEIRPPNVVKVNTVLAV